MGPIPGASCRVEFTSAISWHEEESESQVGRRRLADSRGDNTRDHSTVANRKLRANKCRSSSSSGGNTPPSLSRLLPPSPPHSLHFHFLSLLRDFLSLSLPLSALGIETRLFFAPPSFEIRH